MNSPESESPCIGVCQLDQDNVCQGCFRTLSEIAMWTKFSRLQKAAVLLEVKRRAKTVAGSN